MNLPVAPQSLLACEQCGEPLSSVSEIGCLNCLLRAGLAEPESDSTDPLRFQHYEVSSHGELGRGAMGVTYRARDINLDAPVALKVINEKFSASAQARERFHREARAAAQLRHPNVARVFHFGETESDRCFYVMELVEGETLEAKIRREGPLSVSLSLGIATQVTRALIAAEAQGLVHRDLKPSNIMLAREVQDSEDVTVKVIDFGLARIAAEAGNAHGAGMKFSGTPGFASPEQLADTERIDTRSDIYSLGATLWYALSGATPFAALPAKTPAPINALLRAMLSPAPAARPQTARDLFVRLRDCQKAIAPKKLRWLLLGAAVILVVAALGAYSPTNRQPLSAAPPEKSIAVLPFQNLTDAKENAYFAIGVQDEVLSNLAQIADLKVISRTSVMRYQSETPRNLREIGQSLGVANVVEGSVQRIGQRIRVVAQLIDARTDSHLWAETYDRNVPDIFAIQDEIAEKIVERLRAIILPREKALIAEKPTSDLTAYSFYERAKNLNLLTSADWKKRVQLLQEAIARDPNYILAYCLLEETYSRLYVQESLDSDAERIETAARAREITSIALRLRPDRGEPHLARAHYLFSTEQYSEARRELEVAIKLLPNDAEARFLGARLDRHENRWEDALKEANQACELDPQNTFMVIWTAETYMGMRRYREHEKFVQAARARNPEASRSFDLLLAKQKLAEGDLAAARSFQRDITDPSSLLVHVYTDYLAHDYSAALRRIAEAPPAWVQEVIGGKSPDTVFEAEIFRAWGNAQAAERTFRAAGEELDRSTKPSARNAWYYASRSEIEAGLGHKEQAIRAALQATEMHPIASDPVFGPGLAKCLAQTYAWTGERDRAIDQLEILSKIPSGINYGELLYSPRWDSLRGDSRFERIVTALKPK